MQQLYRVILTSALALFSSLLAAKSELEIIWHQPENYSDVQSSNNSRERFEQRTFKALDKFIAKLASKLPDGQKLRITVKDLDLAGKVTSGAYVGFGRSGSDVRVISPVNMPRMDFSYQLLDGDGAIIRESDVYLTDPNFKYRFNPFRDSSKLRYEKNMLRLWFKQELPALLVEN